EPIYICEGEKDVLTAEAAGLTATTNAGGALSWSDEHAKWLAGAGEVVIVADHDAPGYRRAEKVMDSLAGRVGSVRVLRAATGKDLTDHIEAGHHVGELAPVPYLDPHTATSAARSEAGAVPFVGEASTDLSADASPLSPDHNDSVGGSFMSGNSTVNLSGLHGQEAGHHHDDTIDHIGSKFAMLIRGLMQDVLTRANESARRRREALKEQEQRDAKKAREQAAALAAQRKAAETALEKIRKTGWDRLSRSEVAVALHEAVTWSEESDTARRAAVELASHIKQRWGVEVDLSSGKVTVDEDMTPKLAAKMAAAEQERAAKSRLATAQDR
ncbi:toprim domain-containing protein, partial [Nocardia sp. 852002-20019_SCH5090214]|uniref:toprim domain-containing protein n=1 Tax=Nocardia sp. 852002-20019_SCH5090214 TaxID=1834087 RepID=UPI0012EAEBD9